MTANAECPLCTKDGEFHLHCMVCRGPLDDELAKTHDGPCRAEYKAWRRKRKSVRVWVQPLDESAPRRQAWVPKRAVGFMDTGVSEAVRPVQRPQSKNGVNTPRVEIERV